MWAQGCNYTGSAFVTGYMPYRLARHSTPLSSGENTEARSVSHQECWHIPELRVTYRNRPAARDEPRTRNLWPSHPEISLTRRLISRQTVASVNNSVCELSMKTGNENAQLWRWSCWASETQNNEDLFPSSNGKHLHGITEAAPSIPTDGIKPQRPNTPGPFLSSLAFLLLQTKYKRFPETQS